VFTGRPRVLAPLYTMYTQCPECKTSFPIRVDELRDSRGIHFCPGCNIKFDALELLSETAPAAKKKPAGAEKNNLPGFKYNPDIEENYGPLPWEKPEVPPVSRLWGLGFVASLLVLCGQVYYFEYENLSRNPAVRPLLESLCAKLNCTTPPYYSPAEIRVIQSALRPVSKQVYRLQTVVKNQAPFAQPYPNIRLSLLSLKGDVFASRVFGASDYFPGQAQTVLFKADEITQIQLDIIKPESSIGGYTLEIL